MIDEEIADSDGSLAFGIEIRSIVRQCKAISLEPKPISGHRYGLGLRHEGSRFLRRRSIKRHRTNST